MRNLRCRWMRWTPKFHESGEHRGTYENIDTHVMPVFLADVIRNRIIREYAWPPDEEGQCGNIYLDIPGPILDGKRVLRLRLRHYDAVVHWCNVPYVVEWLEGSRGRRQEGDVRYVKVPGQFRVACIPEEDVPKIIKKLEPHVEDAALGWQAALAKLSKSEHVLVQDFGAKEIDE